MTANEAKSILLRYRPGTADAEDPQVAEALGLAKSDAELAAWLKDHCARQEALRAKFQQITPPPGLREQIISEHRAQQRAATRRRSVALALSSCAALVAVVAFFVLQRPPREPDSRSLAVYQNAMVSFALKGYGMDLLTNDATRVRNYLATRAAPADFKLPAGLERRAELLGCAVQQWQSLPVSLVCYRSGKPLPAGTQNDLWLFVVDSAAVKDPPPSAVPQVAKVNRLLTATWTEGGKLYLLAVVGTQEDLNRYLTKGFSHPTGPAYTEVSRPISSRRSCGPGPS